MNKANELAHYGVKGMKWGVRKKYEYKGGSRTKKGVDKFNKRLSEYEDAKRKVSEAKRSGNKFETKKAKANAKGAKKALTNQYKKLKRAKRADAGALIYESGHTIGSLESGAFKKRVGVFVSGVVANYAAEKTGNKHLQPYITTGAVATMAMINAKAGKKQKLLRAYYAYRN